jgi:hypothetical protein
MGNFHIMKADSAVDAASFGSSSENFVPAK